MSTASDKEHLQKENQQLKEESQN